MTEKEIKLKVKLEDIVILTESVIKLANEVYTLHREVEMENDEELRLLCQIKKN